MHELSIVRNIVEIATQHVMAHTAEKVERIEMEIGTLSGVEMDAFLFAWEVAVQESVLENAKRIIHPVQARAKCMNCSMEFNVRAFYDVCPDCGEYIGELIRGKELKVKTLVLI